MSRWEVGDKVIYIGNDAMGSKGGSVGRVCKTYYGNGLMVLYSVDWGDIGIGSGYSSADLDSFPTTLEGIEEWLNA